MLKLPSKIHWQLIFFSLGLSFLGLIGFLFIGEKEKTKKQEGLFYQTLGTYTREHKAKETTRNKAYYTLEFGVFETEEEARKLVDSLAKKKITAYYNLVSSEEEQISYRVRGILYQQEEKARDLSEKLRISKKIDSKVLTI